MLLPSGAAGFWINTKVNGGWREDEDGGGGLDGGGGHPHTAPCSLSSAADPDSVYPQKKVFNGPGLLRILYAPWKRIWEC